MISAKNLADKVKQKLTNIRERQWADCVLQSAKLRTYRTLNFRLVKKNTWTDFCLFNRDRQWHDSVVVPSRWPLSWDVIDGQLSPLNNELVVCVIIDKLKMRSIFLFGVVNIMTFVIIYLDPLTLTTLQMSLNE